MLNKVLDSYVAVSFDDNMVLKSYSGAYYEGI